jgi:hypothetical protein
MGSEANDGERRNGGPLQASWPKRIRLDCGEWVSCFPPRLDWQPIFYPVLNEEYATFIAREWNTKDAASGFVGYVLRFSVRADYLAKFQVQKVGGATALEYWIPAEELTEFNANIVGVIEVIGQHKYRDSERSSE